MSLEKVKNKTYNIGISFTGFLELNVQAINEEEANKKALDLFRNIHIKTLESEIYDISSYNIEFNEEI